MSHFTVIVVGDDPERQLAPFHEFECTGRDDEFVQDTDVTEEARREFETGTVTRYRDPDGNLHEPWDERFYRDPAPDEKDKVGMGSGCGDGLIWDSRDWGDGKGYRAKVRFRPEGWDEVKVPRHEVASFKDFVEEYYGKRVVPHGVAPDLADKHKYGYALLDECGQVGKVVRRTNPNAKWDWHTQGGRWRGFFRLKDGTKADQARKGEIDFDGMRREAAEKAAKRHDRVTRLFGGKIPMFKSWKEFLEDKTDIEQKRKDYWDQPALKQLKEIRDSKDLGDEDRDLVIWIELDEYRESREEYMEKAARRAASPFAVVRDSQWHEQGEMGWWAIVTDEKAEDVWLEQVNKLLDEAPDDTLLTLVDCHI